ncbi:NUDIX domain-containing protein [Candidatus Wolfebacteria bacterium]|nr:NUDIX domain-containing protein [Candidatus Wolfebacteria bacterium]
MENNIVLQVGVKILLKNKDGKYLMLRRSLEKYPDINGRWDIPGGRIETGKTLLENLKREVLEETGLELADKPPRLITAQDILRNNNRHVVRLTYIGEADGEVKLDTNENDMYKWYDWEELQKLDDVDVYFKELLNDKTNDLRCR